MEKKYILKVLDQLKWNRSLAARLLGIDRKTLRDKLKKWGKA
ncbi:MAG: helix-turn-helix domain-containing protein [Caldimicrobium sp.]